MTPPCQSGLDPESRVFLVPAPCFHGVTRRDDVWIPAPVPDRDPGFTGMTAFDESIKALYLTFWRQLYMLPSYYDAK